MSFPSQTFNGINHGYRAAIFKKNSLWLFPFFMVVATYCYYEEVCRTMLNDFLGERIINTNYLLNWKFLVEKREKALSCGLMCGMLCVSCVRVDGSKLAKKKKRRQNCNFLGLHSCTHNVLIDFLQTFLPQISAHWRNIWSRSTLGTLELRLSTLFCRVFCRLWRGICWQGNTHIFFLSEPAVLKKINVKKRRKKKVTEAHISDLDDDFAENNESNYSKSLVDETTDRESPQNTSKSYANDNSIQQYLRNNTNNMKNITLINKDNSDNTDFTKTSNSARVTPLSLSPGDNLEDNVVNENSYTQSLSARLKILQNQSADTGDKEIVNLKQDKDDGEVKNLSVETLENIRSDSGNVSPDISDKKIHSSTEVKREFATPEMNDTSLSTPKSSVPAERDSFSEDTPLNTNVISESFIPVTFINSTSR